MAQQPVHLHHCRTCNDHYKCQGTGPGCRGATFYRAPYVKCPACRAEGR